MDRKDIELIKEIEQRSKSNTKRLDEHDKKIEELSDVYIALTKTNDKVDNIETDVKDIKSDIKEIKDKPGRRLDQIIGYVLSALIGGVIGYILLKLGLK
ncbi:MAG: hypothetical protein HFE81_00810 [Bacilli bacterium]|nr:hypothetical protein [Bacilli bacterium]